MAEITGPKSIELPTNLSEALEATERKYILKVLLRTEGDKDKAAYELGILLQILYYRYQKLGNEGVQLPTHL